MAREWEVKRRIEPTIWHIFGDLVNSNKGRETGVEEYICN
jgi:hypothetical protein